METLIATEVHDDKANRALEDDHVAEKILELIKCESSRVNLNFSSVRSMTAL